MFKFDLIRKELCVFGANLSNNEIKKIEDEYYEKEQVKPNDFEEEKKLIANEINKIFSLVIKASTSVNGIFNKLDKFLYDVLKFCKDNKIKCSDEIYRVKYRNSENYKETLEILEYIKSNIPRTNKFGIQSGLSIDVLKERYEQIKDVCLHIDKANAKYDKNISIFNKLKERIINKPNNEDYTLYDHIRDSMMSGDFETYELYTEFHKISYFTNEMAINNENGIERNQNKKRLDLENTLLPVNELINRINKWKELFKFITPTVFIELEDFKKETEHYAIKIKNIKSFQDLENLKDHSIFLRNIIENTNTFSYIHQLFSPMIESSKSLSNEEKEIFRNIISDSNKIVSENDLKKIVIEELFLNNNSKSFQPKELQTLKYMFKTTTAKDLFMLCRRTYTYKNDLKNFVKFITEINFSKNELQEIFSKNIPNLMKIYEYVDNEDFTGKPYNTGSKGYVYLQSDLKEIFYNLAISNKSFDLLPDIFRDIHNFDENSSKIQKSVNIYNTLNRKNQKASAAITETRIQDLIYKNIQNNSRLLTLISSNKNYNSFNTAQGKDLYRNYIELNKYNFDINKLKSKFKITTEQIKEILSTYTDEEYQKYLTTIKDIFDKNVKINVADSKVKQLNSKIKTFIEVLKNTTVYAKYNKVAEPKNQVFSKLSEEVEGFTFRSMPNKDFDMLNKIGIETNCCQFVGGAGSDAAVDSFINSMASVLVLEKDGNLISQSYFHYVPVESDPNGPGIILDNVETNDDNVERYVRSSKYSLDLLYKLYGEKVCNRLNLKYVKCGKQYNKLTSSFFTKGIQDQDYRTFKTKDVYTDFDPEDHLDVYNFNKK